MLNEDRLVNSFLELVKMDSPSGQERKVADFLLSFLSAHDYEVYEDDAGRSIGGNAGNVIGYLSGEGDPVLLCAHMDTVEPGRGVKPVLENKTVRSSGDTILGGDDKAGIAAILELLSVIGEEKLPHPPLQVIFTIGEEIGLKGARELDFSRLSCRFGFVLDSGGHPGTIVTQAPSEDLLNATVIGRSAHAGSRPEDGINAIQVAARAISAMRLGRIDPVTTANIGVIEGGKATNIVPDRVRLEGEARSLEEARLKNQSEHMRQALEQACRDAGAALEIEIRRCYSTYKLGEEDRAVQLALRAARDLGFEPLLTATGGGSDANIFNERGIQAAVLGIGMKNVHTTKEYIEVQDMVDTVRLLHSITCGRGAGKI